MMEQLEGAHPILLGTGAAFLVFAGAALFTEQAGLSGAFALLALFSMLAAVFGPRMEGKQVASLSGIELNLAVAKAVARKGSETGLSPAQMAKAMEDALGLGDTVEIEHTSPVGRDLTVNWGVDEAADQIIERARSYGEGAYGEGPYGQ